MAPATEPIPGSSQAGETAPTPNPSGGGEPAPEKTRLSTLAVQLFVVPLAVVLICVALGGLFVWMTAEHKDLDDYLSAVRSSTGERQSQQAQYLLHYIEQSKRWQGIFDVTARMSAGPDEFRIKNPRAVPELIQIFDGSEGQEPKTRRYLALVLGLLGDKQALPSLRHGLDDADADTVKNCLWALGRLGDDDSAGRVIALAHHGEPSVRLMAVYVLGALNDPQAAGVLAAALNDPDDLVQWNAAFALANKGDAAGHGVLVRLLDKTYVDRFGTVTAQNRQRYRVAAVTYLAKLDKAGAEPMLRQLSTDDPDLQVRNAALQQLKLMTSG